VGGTHLTVRGCAPVRTPPDPGTGTWRVRRPQKVPKVPKKGYYGPLNRRHNNHPPPPPPHRRSIWGPSVLFGGKVEKSVPHAFLALLALWALFGTFGPLWGGCTPPCVLGVRQSRNLVSTLSQTGGHKLSAAVKVALPGRRGVLLPLLARKCPRQNTTIRHQQNQCRSPRMSKSGRCKIFFLQRCARPRCQTAVSLQTAVWHLRYLPIGPIGVTGMDPTDRW